MGHSLGGPGLEGEGGWVLRGQSHYSRSWGVKVSRSRQSELRSPLSRQSSNCDKKLLLVFFFVGGKNEKTSFVEKKLFAFDFSGFLST